MGKRALQQAKFFQDQVDRLKAQRAEAAAAGGDLKKLDTEIRVLESRIAKLTS